MVQLDYNKRVKKYVKFFNCHQMKSTEIHYGMCAQSMYIKCERHQNLISLANFVTVKSQHTWTLNSEKQTLSFVYKWTWHSYKLMRWLGKPMETRPWVIL